MNNTMNVAQQILAELTLNGHMPEEAPCHFMRLPLELRKRIYALLLLAPPVTRVHCSIGPYTKQCSPGGRFLASTCKPKPTVMRTISCDTSVLDTTGRGTCEWRGGDVHTAIICTNKTICDEASDVLYENCQLPAYGAGSVQDATWIPNFFRAKIRRLVKLNFIHQAPISILPGLKVVEFHLDVDFSGGPPPPIYPGHAKWLLGIKDVEIIVDVHIVCAWNGDDWGEPIVSRRGNEARALELEEEAHKIRRAVVGQIKQMFRLVGKSVKIVEN